MSTKVTIIGEQQELKKIVFTRILKADLTFVPTSAEPSNWGNIELICKEYTKGADLMFAYESDRNKGIFYTGHFNDGVV